MTAPYLPRRYRWQDNAELNLMMEYLSLSWRERERRIAAGLARLNATKPRLQLVTPEMDEGLDRIVQRLRRRAG